MAVENCKSMHQTNVTIPHAILNEQKYCNNRKQYCSKYCIDTALVTTVVQGPYLSETWSNTKWLIFAREPKTTSGFDFNSVCVYDISSWGERKISAHSAVDGSRSYSQLQFDKYRHALR